MSYFGRIRIWNRSSNSGFVACEDFTYDLFLDGNTECEDSVQQGDYVFF